MAVAKDADASKDPVKKPSVWARLGLNMPTMMMMVKGSIPPIIALSIQQSDSVAKYYGTLGYLVAIISILGFCIMPRGLFIQSMALNVIGTCVGCAANLLALYAATQARLHTTPKGSSIAGYNSSATAVCAIFFIVQIYLISYLRVARPQFQFACIMYTILTTVALTYGVLFPNMTYAENFVRQLLVAFLSGLGLATGVHFVVFPTSSRKVLLKEMTAYCTALGGVLKAQTAYVHSLEDIDIPAPSDTDGASEEGKHHRPKGKPKGAGDGPLTNAEALALNAAVAGLIQLHLKIEADLRPAKREFALGKLESHNLTQIWKHLRRIFVPVLGLTTSAEVAQRRAAAQAHSHGKDDTIRLGRHDYSLNSVQFLMKQLREPCSIMTSDIERGMQHVLLTLELIKPNKPKREADEEAAAGAEAAPGTAAFLSSYRASLEDYQKSAEKTLGAWCQEHGIALPAGSFGEDYSHEDGTDTATSVFAANDQRQLFVILYQEFLLWKAGRALLDLILYVEECKQQGVLKRTKLIFPGSKTLYKSLGSLFGKEDMSERSDFVSDLESAKMDTLNVGTEFGKDVDPEHLPPRNALEKFGEGLRTIPRFFRSSSSSFAFRVTCASMSLAIVCFLESTQQFFIKNRLLWALIMVNISMTKTSGQSILTFTLRILGTVIAMAGSLVVWYIVDGKTAGVLVFLWLWMTLCFYFVLKTPKLVIVAVLGMVTTVLIIGYELEVRKLGRRVIESNGQEAYPVYLLAPYRLATVAAGLFVAFIWTILPYPVSESTEIRKDLGVTLYLTANFYSIVHEMVQTHIKGALTDSPVAGAHARRLEKARTVVFAKLMALTTAMDSNLAFSKFQIYIGGRFPRSEYTELVATVRRVIRNLALISYASMDFSTQGAPGDRPLPSPDRSGADSATTSTENDASVTRTTTASNEKRAASPANAGPRVSKWSADFRRLVLETTTTSHQTTSLLSLLSSSVSNGQRLPPYLELPTPYREVESLQRIDADILSTKHILEPEYAAFAVLQLCSQSIGEDIEAMVRLVEKLVGVMDFTFHAVSTSDARPGEAEGRDSGSTDEKGMSAKAGRKSD